VEIIISFAANVFAPEQGDFYYELGETTKPSRGPIMPHGVWRVEERVAKQSEF